MPVIVTITSVGAAAKTVAFDVASEFTIGRSPSCECSLPGDGLVSRMHAALLVDPPEISVKDLKSTNGISINGVKYGGNSGNPLDTPLPLGDGDEVKVGKTILKVRILADGDDGAAVTVQSTPREAPADAAEAVDVALPSIPGYRMERVLGSGGMGAVFLGINEETGEKAAIKVMISGLSLNRRMVDTFMREIDVTKTVRHPNIVRFYDSGVAEGDNLYLALEYVNGGDLATYIKGSPGRRLPLEEAVKLMLEVADGMAHAHSLNFVHRDIKPQNVLLANDGGVNTAKVTDLGLAKNFENSGLSGLTSSFAGGGTMAYMPPEQLTEFRDVRPSADVFSMGATFYEMLSGHIPYNFSKKGDRLKVISNADIIPLERRVTGVPDALVAVVDRCLRPEPEDRFQNASELLAALRGCGI